MPSPKLARLQLTDSERGALEGLTDAPRPGAPRKITDEQVEVVVTRALTEQGPGRDSHWSTRSMAGETGLSQSSVSRIWKAFGLKPHLVETWKLSADPEFIAKVAQSRRRHRHQQFLRFLKLIDSAVPKHPRFRLHFTPTSSSWLNLVESWFAELTSRKLRRSAHRSVTELEDDIRKWINEWNKNPKPFTWTKSADDILEALAEYCQRVNGPGDQAPASRALAAYTTQPRLVSVSGRSSAAAASAAAASPSPRTRRHATALAADERETRGPSQRSASTVSPGAAKTEATIVSAFSPSKEEAMPHPGTTGASSGSLSRFAAHAANSPPGRSTLRASRIGTSGSA